MQSLKELEGPKVWLKYFTEWQLKSVIASVVRSSAYERYTVISDDCIVTQRAYDSVLQLHEDTEPGAVITGFCNLDVNSNLVNLTKYPFVGSSEPTKESYIWYSQEEIDNWPDTEPVTTYFAGMSLTCMSRNMWRKFPWDCFGPPLGWAADYHLALRLRDAGVSIFAPKDGFVYHTKPDWLIHKAPPGREILVGKRIPTIKWEK